LDQEKSGNPGYVRVLSRTPCFCRVFVTCHQSDQIGRIFAFWVIVYFRRFFKLQISRNFWVTFFNSKNYAITLSQHGLAKILGRFFAQTYLVTLPAIAFL
jgi:hypothetical protein